MGAFWCLVLVMSRYGVGPVLSYGVRAKAPGRPVGSTVSQAHNWSLGFEVGPRFASGAVRWLGLVKKTGALSKLAHRADSPVYVVLGLLLVQRFLHESGRIVNF